MSALQFIASLAGSLAWPVLVFSLALVFRKQLSGLLARPLSSIRAGMFTAEWDREVAETTTELIERPSVQRLSLNEDLLTVARVSPAAAVVEAFARLERQLRQLLTDAGLDSERLSAARAARQAFDAGLLSQETMTAIERLADLRNLAAHGRGDSLDESRAVEFFAMVDAVAFLVTENSKQAP